MNKKLFSNFKIIIPARYQSSRFEGKILKKIAGMSMLERVFNQAKLSKAQNVIIATDDKRIEKSVKKFSSNFDGEVFYSQTAHSSGTQRISEVAKAKKWLNDEIIINLQADEPFINPIHIQKLAKYCHKNHCEMATLATKANENQLQDNNCVKVVKNQQNQALYFSRSSIPKLRNDFLEKEELIKLRNKNLLRHVGIYAFKADFLQKLVRYPKCDLEVIESLEQLRALYYGHKIDVLEVDAGDFEISIDDKKSLNAIKAKFE